MENGFIQALNGCFVPWTEPAHGVCLHSCLLLPQTLRKADRGTQHPPFLGRLVQIRSRFYACIHMPPAQTRALPSEKCLQWAQRSVATLGKQCLCLCVDQKGQAQDAFEKHCSFCQQGYSHSRSCITYRHTLSAPLTYCQGKPRFSIHGRRGSLETTLHLFLLSALGNTGACCPHLGAHHP